MRSAPTRWRSRRTSSAGRRACGALVAGPRAMLSRRLHGGGQERGLRAGTENVSGIAGFGAAAAGGAARSGRLQRQAGVARRGRRHDWSREARRDGSGDGRAAPAAHTLLRRAGLVVRAAGDGAGPGRGDGVSAGAACSSGKVKPSQVRGGHGPRGPGALRPARVSGGWATPQGRLGPLRRGLARRIRPHVERHAPPAAMAGA